MKTVGTKTLPPIHDTPTATALVLGAQLSEVVTALSGAHLIRKGLYRFRTHAEANAQDESALLENMVRRARLREAVAGE
jgi:hypothetical protein